MHLALVVAVPAFLVLGDWQLHRALGGNSLSWAYTFEWPFFAGYATWMWWKLVHEEVRERAAATAGVAGATVVAASDGHDNTPAADATAAGPDIAAGGPAPASVTPPADWDPYDEADPELAAYNRYLAELRTEPRNR
jgi:hypothetical protein